MTDHHIYGTSTYNVGELVRCVNDRLGLLFSERGSDCQGVCY
ncbi:hypothetical protein ACWCOZ_00305 [Streptomyces sp. NPDC001840]